MKRCKIGPTSLSYWSLTESRICTSFQLAPKSTTLDNLGRALRT